MHYRLEKILEKTAFPLISGEFFLSYLRQKRLYQKGIILRYHEVTEDDHQVEAWTIVKKNEFIQQMEYLLKHFKVESLQNALESLKNPEKLESDKPIAVVTFDDGYQGNHRVLLPIVKSMHLPVTVFVATRAVLEEKLYWDARVVNALQSNDSITLNLSEFSIGCFRLTPCRGSRRWHEIDALLKVLKKLQPGVRKAVIEKILEETGLSGKRGPEAFVPLTLSELREMGECKYISLEAHSHCHNILTQLTEHEIKESLTTSKTLLESWTNRPVNYFAYPNGDHDGRVIHLVKEAGFQCGVITHARPWDPSGSLFSIPRIGIGRYDTFENFKLKVSSGGMKDLFQSWI